MSKLITFKRLLIVTALFLAAFYFFVLQKMVLYAYDHSDLPFLGSMISGQRHHSREHYVLYAQLMFIKTLICASLFVLLGYFMRRCIAGKKYHLIVLVVSIFAAVSIASWVCSFIYHDGNFYIPHDIYHHSFQPNARSWQSALEWRSKYNINSLGFRDNEIQENTDYWVFLGDSFTAGQGVEAHETFPKIVGERLKEKKIRIKTFNAGIISFAPSLEFLALREIMESKAVRISAVILFLDLTDIQDDYKYESIAQFDSYGNLTAVPPEQVAFSRPQENMQNEKLGLKRVLAADIRELGLYKMITNARLFRTVAAEDEKNIQYDRLGHCRPGADWTEHFDRTARYLRLIRDYLRLHGKPLVLAVYPHEFIAEANSEKHNECAPFFDYFTSFAQQENIPLLDLRQPLFEYMKQHPKKRLFYKRDAHFTREGHQMIGDLTAEYLIKELDARPELSDNSFE